MFTCSIAHSVSQNHVLRRFPYCARSGLNPHPLHHLHNKNSSPKLIIITGAAEPMKKWYGNRGGGGGGGSLLHRALRICASMHKVCDGANAFKFVCAHAVLSLRKWYGVAAATQKEVRHLPDQPYRLRRPCITQVHN